MPKHLLCADDSVTMQKVVAITFGQTDYVVHGARSADEALALAKQTKPDLVLADAVMPGKTGYDLCLALKSDPATKGVPVVILCGNSQAYDETRGKAVGADGHLPKPWDTQTMLDKVNELMGRIASSGVAVATGGPAAAAPAPTPPAPPPAAPAMPPPRPAAPPMAAAPPAKPAAPPSPVPARPAAPPIPMAASAPPPPVHKAPPAPAASPIRSATIMGMPAVELKPATTAPPIASGPASAVPSVPKQPGGLPRPPMIRAAQHLIKSGATRPSSVPGVQMPVRPPPPGVTSPRAATPTPAATPPPVITPASVSEAVARAAAPVVAAAAVPAVKAAVAAAGHDPRGVEYETIAKLSREIIEKIAWEVVPELAEQIVRQHVEKLAASRRS
jgi:CheY-like chemotaxis protein